MSMEGVKMLHSNTYNLLVALSGVGVQIAQ
jgi:hypothetical protein